MRTAKLNNPNDLEALKESLRISEHRLVIATEGLRKAEERAVAGRLAMEVMHEVRNPLEALGHLTYLALQERMTPTKFGSICSRRRSKCTP